MARYDKGHRDTTRRHIIDVASSQFRESGIAAVGLAGIMAEAGLTKADVRALSRRMELPTWDLPASPCLASRLPHGTVVTIGALRRVEAAEAAVRALGFRELRVRHLGQTGKVEIAPAELGRLADPVLRREVEEAVRAAGYTRVTIDPEGYRRGSLNLTVRR